MGEAAQSEIELGSIGKKLKRNQPLELNTSPKRCQIRVKLLIGSEFVLVRGLLEIRLR